MSKASTAPISMSVIRGAVSSCRKSTRAAEQRCPALSKAERTQSRTTCSGSAVESTIIALMPPVSATNGMMALCRSESAFWIAQAVSLEPVKAMPPTRGSLTRALPTLGLPVSRCRTSAGTPASCSSVVAKYAAIGVCSAGFASTVFPVARAAATWPVKIANGKFQGEMQAKTPRPRRSSVLSSPVGPGSVTGPSNNRRASHA